MQGGVTPKCVQGSIVTYISELTKFFLLIKALNSACGLPFLEVTPDDITEPSFTTTQPTDGFKLVFPKLF